MRLGDSALLGDRPAELATAAAFARTAELAGRPGNVAPLAEAGRLFGRVAHLLDAVEDHAADAAAGAWNPLRATGTSFDEARRLCEDAVLGVELALREAEFADAALVHALLVHELRQAVRRAFGHGAHFGPGSAFESGGLAGQRPPPGWIGRGPAPQQHPHQGPPGSGAQRGFPPPGPVPPPGAPGPGGPEAGARVDQAALVGRVDPVGQVGRAVPVGSATPAVRGRSTARAAASGTRSSPSRRRSATSSSAARSRRTCAVRASSAAAIPFLGHGAENR